MSDHPNSSDPTISKINDLIYRTFPPRRARGGAWLYGKLYYYGELFTPGNHQWMLDGITPVGLDCVLGVLLEAGADLSAIPDLPIRNSP